MTMKSFAPAHLRSVVLAGHAGGGKTTLAEQQLFRAGAIPRLGRVDTPGYPEFAAEVISGMAAADGALFVVDATGGVEAGLENAVALGRSTGRAACFFLNRCDKENADPTAALDTLRARFGNKIAPLHLAIGKGEHFTGYVDLVHRKAYALEGGKEVEVPVPDELTDEIARR